MQTEMQTTLISRLPRCALLKCHLVDVVTLVRETALQYCDAYSCCISTDGVIFVLPLMGGLARSFEVMDSEQNDQVQNPTHRDDGDTNNEEAEGAVGLSLPPPSSTTGTFNLSRFS